MVDFRRVAIADVLKHPKAGLVSNQSGFGDPVQDEIIVRDKDWKLMRVLASECVRPTEEERSLYWRQTW